MEKIKTVTYTLPAFWACPLINGDESGLTDKESEALQAWQESEAVGACVGGYLVSMQYMGCTKKEAVARFKAQHKGG